jgi:transcriptional regulator with XRE-family HTH domain
MEEICLKKASMKLDELMLNIAFNLRKIRSEKNLTQNDLAYYIGTDKSVISSIETCSNNGINLYTLVKISEALKIPVINLLKNHLE